MCRDDYVVTVGSSKNDGSVGAEIPSLEKYDVEVFARAQLPDLLPMPIGAHCCDERGGNAGTRECDGLVRPLSAQTRMADTTEHGLAQRGKILNEENLVDRRISDHEGLTLAFVMSCHLSAPVIRSARFSGKA